MKTLISSVTRKSVDSYMAQLWPVLLIIGPQGSGKRRIVDMIVEGMRNKNGVSGDGSDVLSINTDNRSISIDDVRGIKSWVKLHHATKNKDSYRLIIIHDAHRMTHEAQNALLKVLEDTPHNTLFIISASQAKSLLDTVVSRTQMISIVNPTEDETIDYFSGSSVEEVTRLYRMTSGLSGYMINLMDDKGSELSDAMQYAKDIMKGSVFERLSRVDEAIKIYPVELLLFALKRINLVLLSSYSDPKQINARIKALKLILHCESLLARSNPNTKLLLTNLLINL